jgi:hypothetical protein
MEDHYYLSKLLALQKIAQKLHDGDTQTILRQVMLRKTVADMVRMLLETQTEVLMEASPSETPITVIVAVGERALDLRKLGSKWLETPRTESAPVDPDLN